MKIILSAMIMFCLINFVNMSQNDQIELQGKDVELQWKTPYETFVIITGDRVNLRSNYGINSKVIMQLPVTRRVRIISINEKEEEIGGEKGKWILVQDNQNPSVKGWVFDSFVGYQYQFKKVDSWDIPSFSTMIGDIQTKYVFDKKGNFTAEVYNTYSEKGVEKKREFLNGGIYRFKNVLWFKRDNENTFIYFFWYNEDAKRIELEDLYRGGNISVK